MSKENISEAENTGNIKSNGRSRKKKKKKKSTVKKVLLIILIIIIGLIAAGGIYSAFIIARAPKIDPHDLYSILNESTVIYDDNENEIDTVYSGSDRDNVDFKDMPDDLKDAFIALEDKSFRKHHGFNYVRIIGAIAESVKGGGRISGTSTITQQLARNLYLKETQYDYNVKRKIIEAHYTREIEKELSKDEILEAYLNTIAFGNNCCGVQAASQMYFSKDVKNLNLTECAILAAMPQAPTKYAPVIFVAGGNPEEYGGNVMKETGDGVYVINEAGTSRRKTCLKLMKEQGYITEDQCNKASKVELKDILDPKYNLNKGKAAYFADYVINEVIEDLMDEKELSYEEAWDKVYNGGLRIYSTMDSQAQNAMDEVLSNRSNYPGMNYSTDAMGNIMGRNGRVLLYASGNYFDEDGNFVMGSDDCKVNSDGSITIFKGGRLNIYETQTSEGKDYSLEFKPMYEYDDYQLCSRNGGFINVPAKFKKLDKDGNLKISKDFFKESDNKEKIVINDDGTVTVKPEGYTLRNSEIQPQVAMTIVENSTGHIKAMSGGRESRGRKIYNRAVNPRQPGSSIKPLGVYAPAIQQSSEEVNAGLKHTFYDYGIDKQGDDFWGDYITQASNVVDEKTTINGKAWPKNVYEGFIGNQTLRDALVKSINTCAVKTFYQVGTEYSADMMDKFGISTLVRDGEHNDMNAAALALGGMTKGVTTLDMASAYTVFPNYGNRVDPKAYTKVLDRNGNEFIENEAKSHKVMDPAAAYVMMDMLQGVVTSGTGTRAAISGVGVGGKTGTTDDACDFWFDGFTPVYSAALWVGNDNNIELQGYSDSVAALWGQVMSRVEAVYGGTYKPVPTGVTMVGNLSFVAGTESGITAPPPEIGEDEVKVTICKETGLLATPDCTDTEEKVFKKGEEPKYYCTEHNSDPEKYPQAPPEEENSEENEGGANENALVPDINIDFGGNDSGDQNKED